MFFSLSKILWFLFQPMSLLLMLIAMGLIALFFRARKIALTALFLSFSIIGLCSFTTLGSVMLYPLEERFQRPVSLPDNIDGIILLGGYMNGTINAARGGTEMNSAADRLVETMRLAKHYKNTQIIVTGGEGTYFDRSTPDAVSTAELFDIFGVDDGRVIYESQSRNTIENASFSYDLLHPQKDQRWLLVTSAFHMPRSVGVFRKAGFEVIAWPVDYKTVPDTSFSFYFQNPNQAFARSSTAIHEWLGLIAYWWSGETKEIFPQP